MMNLKYRLHLACNDGNIDAVKQELLTIKKTALNKKITDYEEPIQGTPLHIACENRNLSIVKLLVEAGADLEIKDVARKSALAISASNDDFETARYLLEQGADINSKGPNGMLPIHFSCASSGRNVLDLLLSEGVNINALTSSKSSLLDFTANLNGGNLDAAKSSIENGIENAYYLAAFKEACWRNNVEIAELLIENGVDYHSQTTPKSEMLFWVCWQGHFSIVKLLVSLGVDFKKSVKFKGQMASYNGAPLDKAKELGLNEIVTLIEA